MPEDTQSTAIDRLNRRSVLKSTGVATTGIGGLTGVTTATSASSCRIPSGSDSESEESYRKKESTADHYEYTSGSERYDHLTDLQSTLIYQGADYSEVSERWTHYFRTGGYSKTMQKLSYKSKSSYDFDAGHRYVKTVIDNNDTSRAALYTTNNQKDVTITPAPADDGDPNMGAAAFTLMTAVLGTNPYVGGAITAAQIISALTHTSKNKDGSKVEYKWDYDFDNEPCEEAHFIRFLMESFQGEETANLTVQDEVAYDGYGGVNITFDMFVDAVPDNLQSFNAGAATGSAAYSSTPGRGKSVPEPGEPGYTGWLVRNGFAKRIANDEIQRDEVKEIAKGGPVFRATNPAVQVETTSSPITE